MVMEVVVAGNLHLPNYSKKEKKKDLVLIWRIILCGKNTKITTINDTIVKCHTSSPIMANKRISKIYFRVLNKDVRADYKNCANGINNENGIARSGFNETEKETRVRLKKRFMQSRHAAVFVVTFVWELKSCSFAVRESILSVSWSFDKASFAFANVLP